MIINLLDSILSPVFDFFAAGNEYRQPAPLEVVKKYCFNIPNGFFSYLVTVNVLNNNRVYLCFAAQVAINSFGANFISKLTKYNIHPYISYQDKIISFSMDGIKMSVKSLFRNIGIDIVRY